MVDKAHCRRVGVVWLVVNTFASLSSCFLWETTLETLAEVLGPLYSHTVLKADMTNEFMMKYRMKVSSLTMEYSISSLITLFWTN